MLLSAKMLDQVSSVNSFNYSDRLEYTEGDPLVVNFQLVDLTIDKDKGGRRFCQAADIDPEAPVLALEVTLESIDANRKVVRAASQPFEGVDASIWRVSIQSTDRLRGTITMRLKLTDADGKVYRGSVQSPISCYSAGAL